MTYLQRSGNKYRYKKAKLCKLCGIEFFPSKPMQAFCGYSCASKSRSEKKAKKAQRIKVCKNCKKEIIKRASDFKLYKGYRGSKRGQYCSRECWKSRVQNISSLKQRAWVVFSLYIRNRDSWTCFTCGKIERGAKMHAGHFISRSHNSTLFDEMNVHAQCAGCNMFRNGQPHLYAEKLVNTYGQKEFMSLIARGREIKQFTRPELISLHIQYRAKLRVMGVIEPPELSPVSPLLTA